MHISDTIVDPSLIRARVCRSVLATAVLVCWLPVASATPQKLVVDVAARSQLLIDRELEYEAQGVSFTLHPGRKISRQPL